MFDMGRIAQRVDEPIQPKVAHILLSDGVKTTGMCVQ